MRYFSNVSALQFFHLLRFASLILIGVILAQSGYQTEEIGQYELFFFLANVVGFFWVMGLNNGLMSYFPKLESRQQDRFFFNLGVLLTICGFVASCGLLVFEDQVLTLLGSDSEQLDYKFWIMTYMILSASGNFTEYFYLLRHQAGAISTYGVVLFTAQLSLITIGVILGFEVKGLIQLMVLWSLLKFLWFWITIARKGDLVLDFKMQWVFLGFSLPLILHMLLGNGMEYVDGFLVNYFFDEAAFAQFRYGARELPLVSVLVGAISTALIPVAVNDMSTALRQVRDRISRFSRVLFPISIALMLTSGFIYPLIYGDSFRISAQVFNVYLLIISSRVLMPQVVVFARHNNRVLMISALIELVVNIFLSIYFLKLFGIIGIAWATVIAFLVNKLILSVYIWRKHKIPPSDYINLKQYAIWLSLLIITYYISTLYNFAI